MVTLLRVVGSLNLAGSVLGAVWYWDAFNTVQEVTADFLGVPVVDPVSNPWAIATTIGILAGGFFSFLAFMALAEILEACHENHDGIALLRRRQNQLQQTLESGASE